MFPVAVMERRPDESMRGLFLLATQMTVCSGMFLNQIPTYRLPEFQGLKNPSSNFCPKETILVPLSLMVWFGNKVSVAPVDSNERKPKQRKMEKIITMVDYQSLYESLLNLVFVHIVEKNHFPRRKRQWLHASNTFRFMKPKRYQTLIGKFILSCNSASRWVL